jgi:hypothetical protein
MEKEEIVKDITSMNIYEKMSLITDEVGVVEKKLNVEINKSKSYKAVSERDILDAVKPIEKKYRIYSYPVKREIIDKDTLVKEIEYNGNITRTNTLFMRLGTAYRFVNIDNPSEYIDIDTYGDGLDTGDKATGKAMTYADKYALMKAYKISTGDDPDKDASPENGYKKSKTIRKADEEINLDLTRDFNAVLIESGQDIEDLLAHYGVDNYNELTDEQKIEAIAVMKKKIEKKGKNE